MTTKTNRPQRPQAKPGPTPEDLQHAYQTHTLAQVLYGQLTGAGPWMHPWPTPNYPGTGFTPPFTEGKAWTLPTAPMTGFGHPYGAGLPHEHGPRFGIEPPIQFWGAPWGQPFGWFR